MVTDISVLQHQIIIQYQKYQLPILLSELVNSSRTIINTTALLHIFLLENSIKKNGYRL